MWLKFAFDVHDPDGNDPVIISFLNLYYELIFFVVFWKNLRVWKMFLQKNIYWDEICVGPVEFVVSLLGLSSIRWGVSCRYGIGDSASLCLMDIQ